MGLIYFLEGRHFQCLRSCLRNAHYYILAVYDLTSRTETIYLLSPLCHKRLTCVKKVLFTKKRNYSFGNKFFNYFGKTAEQAHRSIIFFFITTSFFLIDGYNFGCFELIWEVALSQRSVKYMGNCRYDIMR